MGINSVVRISSDKASHYTMSSINASDYDYGMNWFYANFKIPLPVINRFSLTRNMSVDTEKIIEDKYNKESALNKQSLLPLSVRYIDKSGNYYIERPPFKIKINYKNSRAMLNGTVVDDLEIWIPWTLMIIPHSFSLNFDPSSVCLFYSNEQLSSTKTHYVRSLFPNSYENNSICWSQSFQKLISTDNTRDDLSSFDLTYWHSMILNDYMMGGWNNDLQSSSLNNITQHFYHRLSFYADNLRERKGMTPKEAEEYIFKKYPSLYRYIHMEKFPELSQKVRSILMNKFHLPKNAACMLTDLSYVPSGRKRRDNYDHVVGYAYCKLLAFFSVCSLSETLDFYSDVSSYLLEFSPNSIYGRYTYSFSKIISDYNRDFTYERASSNYPILLPFTSLTNNNIDLLSSSASSYKNLKIYYTVEDIDLKDLENYYNRRTIPYRDIFDVFKVDPQVFFFLVDDYINKTNSDTLYLKINAKKNDISVVDKQYFANVVSDISLQIKESLEKSKLKKKKNRYYVDHSSYIDTEEKILNSLNISN